MQRKKKILAGFLLFSQLFERVYFCGFWLTHTVTHTPKCPERDREHQTGSSAFLPGFLLLFLSYMTCAIKFPIVSAAGSAAAEWHGCRCGG